MRIEQSGTGGAPAGPLRKETALRILLLPLLASALSGGSALVEKVSIVSLSPLTVLTLRYLLMLPVPLVALYAVRHRGHAWPTRAAPAPPPTDAGRFLA